MTRGLSKTFARSRSDWESARESGYCPLGENILDAFDDALRASRRLKKRAKRTVDDVAQRVLQAREIGRRAYRQAGGA
jgi:hypothetical protein